MSAFLAANFGTPDTRTKLASATYQGQQVNWHKLFQRSDHNQTGLIDFTEFRSLVRNYARVTPDIVSDNRVEELFKRFSDKACVQSMKYGEFLRWLDGAGEISPRVMGTEGFNTPRSSTSSTARSELYDPSAEKKSDVGQLRSSTIGRPQDHPDHARLEYIKHHLTDSAYRLGYSTWADLFKHYDKNHDGVLRINEFRNIMRNHCHVTFSMVPDSLLNRLFKSADVDGSGTIEFAEFEKWLKLEVGPNVHRQPGLATNEAWQRLLGNKYLKRIRRNIVAGAAAQGGVNWRQLLEAHDPHDSGVIELDDLHQIFQCASLGSTMVSRKMLDHLFHSIDDHDSGVIDSANFLKWLEAKDSWEPPISQEIQVEEVMKKLLQAARLQGNVAWDRLLRYHGDAHSGTISFRDFSHLVRKDGKISTQMVSDAMLSRLKAPDGYEVSGRMDYEAFLGDMKEIEKRRPEEVSYDSPSSRTISPARGILDADQIQVLKQKLTAAAYTEGGVDWYSLFHHHDRDNSETITFVEFRKLVRKDAKIVEKVVSTKKLERLFASLDKDGSGLMEFKEFAAWLGAPEQTLKEFVAKPLGSPNRTALSTLADKQRQASEQVFRSFAAALASTRAARQVSKMTDPDRNFATTREAVGYPIFGTRSHVQQWLDEQGPRTPEELARFGFRNEVAGDNDRHTATIGANPLAYDDLTNSMDYANLLMWISYCELDVMHRKRPPKLRQDVSQRSKPPAIAKNLPSQLRTKFTAAVCCIDWAKHFHSHDPLDKGTIGHQAFLNLVRHTAGISHELLPKVALDSAFNSFDPDHSGAMVYKAFLNWLELPEEGVSEAEERASEESPRSPDNSRPRAGSADALGARKAEATVRVKASLGAVMDLAMNLEKRAVEARRRTEEAAERSKAARTLIKERSQAFGRPEMF